MYPTCNPECPACDHTYPRAASCTSRGCTLRSSPSPGRPRPSCSSRAAGRPSSPCLSSPPRLPHPWATPWACLSAHPRDLEAEPPSGSWRCAVSALQDGRLRRRPVKRRVCLCPCCAVLVLCACSSLLHATCLRGVHVGSSLCAGVPSSFFRHKGGQRARPRCYTSLYTPLCQGNRGQGASGRAAMVHGEKRGLLWHRQSREQSLCRGTCWGRRREERSS